MDKSLAMLLTGYDEKLHKGQKPIPLPTLGIILAKDIVVLDDVTTKKTVNVESLFDLWEDEDVINDFHHGDALNDFHHGDTINDFHQKDVLLTKIPPMSEEITTEPTSSGNDKMNSFLVIICFVVVSYLLYILFAN